MRRRIEEKTEEDKLKKDDEKKYGKREKVRSLYLRETAAFDEIKGSELGVGQESPRGSGGGTVEQRRGKGDKLRSA